MASDFIKGMQDEHNYDGTALKPGERSDRVRTGAVLMRFENPVSPKRMSILSSSPMLSLWRFYETVLHWR